MFPCVHHTPLKKYYYRSSHWRRSIERGVLKNFSKFTGKHLCQGLFFNNVADLGPLLSLSNSTGGCDLEFSELSQLTFTFSKSTIETLKKGVKLNVNDVLLVLLLLTLNFLHTLYSSIFIVDFEKVNVSWIAYSSISVTIVWWDPATLLSLCSNLHSKNYTAQKMKFSI